MYRIIGKIFPDGFGLMTRMADTLEISKIKAAQMRTEGFLVTITDHSGRPVSDDEGNNAQRP
jgi:hypothetical protein